MRWAHDMRCQGCAEEKHRSIYHRANVRQRSVLHWGGWAEELQPEPEPEPEPAAEGEAAGNGAAVNEEEESVAPAVRRYRLRWLRLCDTVTPPAIHRCLCFMPFPSG